MKVFEVNWNEELIFMYVRNDASKMVIQFKSRQETKISGTSIFRLRSSVLFEEENWVTGKETYTILIFVKFLFNRINLEKFYLLCISKYF